MNQQLCVRRFFFLMFSCVVCTCPFSSLPLYTLPKPPSPRRQSERKFFVAVASSRNVNAFAVLLTEQLPLGGSMLVAISDDGLCLCFEATGDGLMGPAKWQEHLMILTRFPGRHFILALGLLHNRDLPGFQPRGRHLLLRLETPKAAHLLPTACRTHERLYVQWAMLSFSGCDAAGMLAGHCWPCVPQSPCTSVRSVT